VYPGGYAKPDKWADDFRVAPFSIVNQGDDDAESGTGDRVAEDEAKVFNSTWAAVATAYSRLQLTYPDADKLVALSGIAERVARSRSDQYVAGVFSNMLPAALMWQVVGTGTASAKSGSGDMYRAPSWSWASKDMPIMYNMTGEKNERTVTHKSGVMVEKIQLDLIDPSNLFGRLRSASLTVKGSLVTAVAKRLWTRRDELERLNDREDGDEDREKDEDEDEDVVQQYSSSVTVALEVPGLQHPKANLTECYLGLDDELLARRLREEITAGKSPDVLLLPVYENKDRLSEDLLPGQTESTETTAGLALEADRSDREASPVYRRLGVFSIHCLILDNLTSIQDQIALVLV
jgi:hypothetical protein